MERGLPNKSGPRNYSTLVRSYRYVLCIPPILHMHRLDSAQGYLNEMKKKVHCGDTKGHKRERLSSTLWFTLVRGRKQLEFVKFFHPISKPCSNIETKD